MKLLTLTLLLLASTASAQEYRFIGVSGHGAASTGFIKHVKI